MTAPASYSRSEHMNANPQTIQKMLDENAHLIKVLVEIQNTKGKAMECIQYQQTLHRNLAFLANLADPALNVQSILPPPGTNMMPQRSQEQVSNSMPPYSMAQMHTAQRPPPPLPQSTWPGEAQGVSTSQQQQQQQQMGGMPGYGSMGGWGGGQSNNPYGMQQQNPMSLSEDQRKMLRMRQEQMIQQQQRKVAASQQQQQQQGGQQHPGTMYLSSAPPVMMGGNYAQPSSISPGPSGPLT